MTIKKNTKFEETPKKFNRLKSSSTTGHHAATV